MHRCSEYPLHRLLLGGVIGLSLLVGNTSLSLAQGPAAAPWALVGPENFTNHSPGGYGVGAIAGRVNAVVVDPTNTEIVYAGSAGGGVWRTTNGGKSWTLITPNLPHMQISSLALDPSNHERLYVGTGDFGTEDPNQAIYTSGVWTTGNATASPQLPTWTHVGDASVDGLTVSKILVDPDNSNLITVATRKGATGLGYLYQHVTAGGNFASAWSAPTKTSVDGATMNGIWSDLKIGIKSATGTRAMYAAATFPAVVSGTYMGGVWRSTDRGAHWYKLGTSARYSSSPFLLAVAPSQINAGTVFFATSFVGLSGNYPGGAMFKSTNYGSSFGALPTSGLPVTDAAGNNIWASGPRSFYLAAGSASTQNGTVDTLLMGLQDIYQYQDLPSTVSASIPRWQAIDRVFSGNDLFHSGQRDIAFVVNTAKKVTAVLANEGGLYAITMNPSTGQWAPGSLNGGATTGSLTAQLPVAQINGQAYGPMLNEISLGLEGNGTAITTDGKTWSLLSGGAGDLGGVGGPTAINWLDGSVAYSTSPGQADPSTATYLAEVYRNGQLISPLPTTSKDVLGRLTPTVIDPNNPTLLYVGSNFLYRWDDAIGSWDTSPNGTQLSSGGTINAIAVALWDDNRIYTGSSDGQIYMTTDGGTTFEQIGKGSALPAQPVTAISVNPNNEDDIVVTFGSPAGSATDSVWEITAASGTPVVADISGAGTANALPQYPVNSIARDPQFPTSVYYVGTDNGLYFTTDGGKDWFAGPTGVPNVVVKNVTTMAYGGTSLWLYAGTYGLGALKYPLADTGKVLSAFAAPNPIQGGNVATGTIQLDGVARKNTTFTLTSSNTSVVKFAAGATVTVAAGTSVQTFAIPTNPVAKTTVVTITLTSSAGTIPISLTVTPPKGLVSFTISPTTVLAGQQATGTLTISSPAPTGGASISISSSDPTVMPPQRVVVPQGATSTTFAIKTGATETTVTATLTASYQGSNLTANLTVLPIPFTGFSLSTDLPNGQEGTVIYGQTVTGTVTIGAPAPPGGTTISLYVSPTGYVNCPATVTVPAGATTANFTITTLVQVTQATQITVEASYAGTTFTDGFTIEPLQVSSITFSPSTVVGGAISTATVTLNSAAAVDTTISVSATAGAQYIASINGGQPIIVKAGMNSVSFPVQTKPVTGQVTAQLTATAFGSSVSGILYISP